jgi:hypothetical protein
VLRAVFIGKRGDYCHWGGRILLQLRCFKVAPKVSIIMCTIGEITVTDYIERESCGILLAILHLEFYVWSFCAFFAWQLHLH